MSENILTQLDSVEISLKSFKLLNKLLLENPRLKSVLKRSDSPGQTLNRMRKWAESELKKSKNLKNYKSTYFDSVNFRKLSEKDTAILRILDYIEHSGETFVDKNLNGGLAITDPFRLLWLAVHKGTGGAKPDFFIDMLELFREFRGIRSRKRVNKKKVLEWMSRYYTGLNKKIIVQRNRNRERIISVLIEKISKRKSIDTKYKFPKNSNDLEKRELVEKWWNNWRFHLKFAARSPEEINEYLDNSLDPDTLVLLKKAEKKGIPFFINPYYLSLLQTEGTDRSFGSDLTIRNYIIYSEKLIEEFGNIVAWEKEDEVKPGKPNAAGWILPSYHNVHRRYPDVAILIPETEGRTCGGLCASCQRMYDFQSGNLGFDMKKNTPRVGWMTKLEQFMDYFRNDSQLKDILITGGDALMNSDKSLKVVLDSVLNMAQKKIEDNLKRITGLKYAEFSRVRLGTRLPAYLPQRITDNLTEILRNFRENASKIGIKQFIIQTHIESPMEITPEMKMAVQKLLDSGWIVTNQHVYTTQASRRGHNAKLRKSLLEIGVIPYYTFSVKGYMENHSNFTPNARIVQELMEEKYLGNPGPKSAYNFLWTDYNPVKILHGLRKLIKKRGMPFISTDRSVMNLPGVGKSLTFRVIGITRYGRRILAFDHDKHRNHSPIIEKMGEIVIIESKSIPEYLRQLEEMGEDNSEYSGIFSYSFSEIEERFPLFEYPDYSFNVTNEITNLNLKN